MKKILLLLCFSYFTIHTNAQDKRYSNPILAGFYPDPSICKAGEDYYLVNSSFSYFPGLPIFHSKDLVNWKQIGHALNRPEQLNLDGAGVSRGLFAPAISYHKGIFYIVCTLIDKLGNFVITSTDPKGPWSNPVALPQVNGIDPALFFDDNDKAYIIFNSDPPDKISLYDGHRTIRMFEFDFKKPGITGAEKLLINGGTDINKKPVWIEGPHIYKKDGWYYLMCAEGGTGYNHSEVVFKSKDVSGPYIPYDKNPILTQRHLDPARKNPVTTTGHADLVQTKEGKWYAVFLACRPYEDDYYNLGRETFMAPVEWKEGWPVILEKNETVGASYPVPMPAVTQKVQNTFSGSFSFMDEFNNNKINDRFVFLRVPKQSWYSFASKKSHLTMQLLPQTCSDADNPAFIGFRQSHIDGSASTSLQFKATSSNEKAGMLIFQSEHYFYYLCESIENNIQVVQLYQSTPSSRLELLASAPLPASEKPLQLKIGAAGNTYSFYYATEKENWQLLKSGVDAKFLSTKTAGGFVGCLYALYATSQGKQSNNQAYFDWFRYSGVQRK